MTDDRQSSRYNDLPDQTDDPLVWDPATRTFVPRTASVEEPPAPTRDPRRFYVGPPDQRAAASANAPAAAPVAPGRPAPARPAPPPPSRPAPQPAPSPSRRCPRFRRPKTKWIVLICALLPVLLILAGLLYADIKFRQINRVSVGNVLDSGGRGDNILIVGSDTRAGGDPNTGASAGDGLGERSDTVMVLHLEGGSSKMLSIPRDLIVTIADTNRKDRINSAYNADLGGGPQRLIKTVKQNFGIPINRYMEVDFVTFAGLVDAVGGITIDFPYPAFDTNTGLDIKQAGPQHLNGEQALAYVRSRHYTEIKEDGKPHEDPTADLGRIQRQQTFLRTVMGKVAGSHNPITLLRVGGEVADGLRVDDQLGLWGAVQLAWNMKGLNPESIPLPVAVNNDHATLHLQQPDANQVLEQFK
jgi:LCP family protein required for cell wall assembly